MEQLDEVHSDINKVESSIKVDVSSSLISESTTDIIKNVHDIPEDQKKKKNKSQECTDNTIQDGLVVNKCDVTDLNKNKKKFLK